MAQSGEQHPPKASGDSLLVTRWTQIGALHGRDAEQAWQWFVGRYRHFVRGILTGLLARQDRVQAAEDEFWGYVFLSGALQRADRDRRFRAFLSGIVRNFARSWARTKGLPIAAEEALEGLPANRGGAQAELTLWVENVVENSLATLRDENPATAKAMECFYGLGAESGANAPKSAGDVATQLGNTTQGVYMLLFRGRKRLRQLVEDELREGCQDDAAWRDELQMLLGIAAAKLPGLVGEG